VLVVVPDVVVVSGVDVVVELVVVTGLDVVVETLAPLVQATPDSATPTRQTAHHRTIPMLPRTRLDGSSRTIAAGRRRRRPPESYHATVKAFALLTAAVLVVIGIGVGLVAGLPVTQNSSLPQARTYSI